MKISLIQMDIVYGQPEQNFANAVSLLEKALQEKPDVIVLPEMWNTGYALADLPLLADRDGRQTKDVFGRFAKEHAVYIVAGSISTIKQKGFYNTTYVFNRKGQLIADYDKVHLFGLMAENQFLQAGSTPSSFDLDGIQAASVICYDIRFPEWVRTLMCQGSQLLFVVAEWPEQRVPQWELLLKARAIENQAFVVAVNRVGDGPDDHFSGHSMVIDPLGQTVFLAPDDEEGVFTVDLDLSEVADVRSTIPVFQDRRPDLYQ